MIGPTGSGTAFQLGLWLACAYLAGRLLIPIAAPLLSAALMAAALWPLHKRAFPEAKVRSNEACLASTIFVCALVVLPLSAAVWVAASQVPEAYQSLRGLIRSMPRTGLLGALLEFWESRMLDGGLGEAVAENAGLLASLAKGFIEAVGRGFRSFLVFLLVFPTALFLFLRDGRQALGTLLEALPLPSAARRFVWQDVSTAVTAWLRSLLAVAVIQGALAMIGLAAFGVRFAVLLGLLCAVLSPIPFVGSAVVWAPIVARLAVIGSLQEAAGLGLWFVLIVGFSDNLVRPLIIGAGLRLSFPVLVVSLAGGVQAFGLMGVFFGPLLAAAAVAAARGARKNEAD